VDLPGYGKSTRNNFSYSLADYACFLTAFIEKKSLKNVVLIGHSMGGQIAVHAVLSSPELFEKLILVAPAGIETFTSQEADLLKLSYTSDIVINTSPEQINANYKINFHTFPEDAEFMVEDRIKMREAPDFPDYAKVVVNNVHAMLDEPVFDRLKEVALPVLMIYGINDLLIPNRFLHPEESIDSLVEKAKENIQDLEVEFIKDAGHFVNFEKSTEVNSRIINFIKNN
jgi:pimeloyl-ACP methyl ester carboxylesterase